MFSKIKYILVAVSYCPDSKRSFIPPSLGSCWNKVNLLTNMTIFPSDEMIRLHFYIIIGHIGKGVDEIVSIIKKSL